MRVSEIEDIAKEAFGCEGLGLQRVTSKYQHNARNAVVAILMHLGFPKTLICERYNISRSTLYKVLNNFDYQVKSVRCDNDIVFFLKLLKNKLYGD